jgi:hypothetical protein
MIFGKCFEFVPGGLSIPTLSGLGAALSGPKGGKNLKVVILPHDGGA